MRFVRWRVSFIAVCFLATLVTFCIFGRLMSATQRPEDSNYIRNQSLQCSYLFDWDFYFRNSPDVKQANVLPEKHFLESGWKEHRMFAFYRSGAVGGQRVRLEVPDCSPSFPPKVLRFGVKEESLYWEFMDVPPLARLLITTSEPQRLNVILPGWDFEHFFGGLISIAQFSIAMSNQGLQVRWISLAPSPSDLFTREELFARFANLKGLESLPSDIEFSPSQPRDLKCSPNDIFMATLYTTAEIAHAYQKQMSNGKFLYFVQDYEPIFYAHSSAYARAMTSYTLPHFALFGTHFLESYFRKYRVGVFGHPSWETGYLTYQNGISPSSEVLATDFARLPQAPRSLLVYLRIEEAHARNMWQLAVAGLSSAIRRGVINPSEWVFHGIGSVTTTGHDICGLGGFPGVCLRLLPQKSQKEYEQMLGSYDIGLALMLSPHPSLVPLDFAAAGMITITNTYDTKTAESLQEISGNILACAPSREEVATAIGRAVIRSRDTVSRAQNAKLNWTSSWISEQAFGISFGNHLRSAYARQPPIVAFIVRTYIRHLDKDEVNGLHGLLNSLSALRYPHWRAYIYVSDPSQAQLACERIDALVHSLADARIIWKRTVAQEPFEYLSNGFRFMDDFAQQVTVDQDEWLVFTNGDNEYLPSALDHLCPLYDAIALNFYSRYASSGSVLNTGSVGGADLGSVLVRRWKWLSERRRFSDMPSTISQDGALFQLIQNEGWHFRYFDSSLVQFSHNPNPINCAKKGHIWVASPRFNEQVCLTNERAALRVRDGELEFSSSCPVPSSRCLRYVARKLAQKQAEEQKRDEEFMKEVCKRTKAERKFGMPVGFPERRWAECTGLFANAEDEAIVRRNLIASVRS